MSVVRLCSWCVSTKTLYAIYKSLALSFLIQMTILVETLIGQCHAKRDLRTIHIVETQISSYSMFKTPIHDQNVYITRKRCAVDVMSVKKCRPWPVAALETLRLVWVYTFCICPKVPFRVTLAICQIKYENLSSNIKKIMNNIYSVINFFKMSSEFSVYPTNLILTYKGHLISIKSTICF